MKVWHFHAKNIEHANILKIKIEQRASTFICLKVNIHLEDVFTAHSYVMDRHKSLVILQARQSLNSNYSF